MGFLDSILGGITMYRLMLYFLIILLVLSVGLSFTGLLPYDPLEVFLQAVILAALCWGINKLIAKLVRTKLNPESAFITALILALIIGPFSVSQGWQVWVVAAGAAMLSKYLLVKGKTHIFNPAAFGAVASAVFLGEIASWWVGGRVIAPFILLGGILVMYKIKRFGLLASFLLAYFGFLFLDLVVWGGAGTRSFLDLTQTLLVSSSLLFFIFVMLPEPLTSPAVPVKRVYFGLFIGAVLLGLQKFFPSISFSVELSLLLGNIFAFVINPYFRQVFALARKENIAQNIVSFWFRPARAFAFTPGQYLEYTLPHSRADLRGTRRFFTIASSPSEENVLLTTKFADPGSSFKKTLKEMKRDDQIIASKVAGDFVLPADKKKKLAFIAGGIGITPFRSIVKFLLDEGERRDMVLLYGVQNENEVAFADVFAEGNNIGLRTTSVFDRINEQTIEKEIPDFLGRYFYVSGPEPMVKGITKMLGSMGVPKKQIKRDFFPGYD